MRWFVYWNLGSCNQGDHDCDLQEFSSLAEAEDKVKELKGRYTLEGLCSDGYVRMIVIHGSVDICDSFPNLEAAYK